MVVPWTGFPLKALVDLAKPLGLGEVPAHGNLQRPVDGRAV